MGFCRGALGAPRLFKDGSHGMNPPGTLLFQIHFEEDCMSLRDAYGARARDSASYLAWVRERLYAASTPDYEKVRRMALETEELFEGEVRLTGEPYHVHCFMVGIISVERAGVCDPDTLNAAVGHDNREFVEEKLDKGVSHTKFDSWRAELGRVEEKFGYMTERLIAANTSPRVNHTRSSRAAHDIFYARMAELATTDIEFFRRAFEVRGSDRSDNLDTLTEKMGVRKLREKISETKVQYLPYADRLGILVPELNEGIRNGRRIIARAKM